MRAEEGSHAGCASEGRKLTGSVCKGGQEVRRQGVQVRAEECSQAGRTIDSRGRKVLLSSGELPVLLYDTAPCMTAASRLARVPQPATLVTLKAYCLPSSAQPFTFCSLHPLATLCTPGGAHQRQPGAGNGISGAPPRPWCAVVWLPAFPARSIPLRCVRAGHVQPAEGPAH